MSASPAQTTNLQQLFLYHVAVIKEQIYKRKVQRQIENSKMPKTEAVISPEVITLNHFKVQDKKMLIRNFFADPNVIRLLAPVFSQKQTLPGFSSVQVPTSHRVSRTSDIKNGGGKNIYGRFLQKDLVPGASKSGANLQKNTQQMVGNILMSQQEIYEDQRPHTQGARRRNVRTKPQSNMPIDNSVKVHPYGQDQQLRNIDVGFGHHHGERNYTTVGQTPNQEANTPQL